MFQNPKNLYKCQFCEQNINQQEKETHYEECDKVASFISDHVCEFCENIFNTQSHLRKHIQRVHRKPKSKYTSEIVEMKSFEEGKLIILQLIKNFNEDDALKFLNWIKDEGMEELHRIVLRSILQNQDHHKIVKSKHISDPENIEVTNDSSMDESTGNNKFSQLQTISQNICKEKSNTEEVLKNQIYKEHNCNSCGKLFKSAQYLKCHINKIHHEEPSPKSVYFLKQGI